MRATACRIGSLAAVLLGLAVPVRAADAPPAAAPQPPQTAAPTAAAPETPPPFRSTLSDYRAYRADEPLRDWREVNDEVGGLRGHGGHLQPQPAETAR